MSRVIYRSLLDLHPRAFRERYSGEMLLIFEEAEPFCGPAQLLADCGASLVRQWIHHPMVWTVAGAVVGGMLPIALAVAMMADWPHIRPHR